ncbi:glutamate racemase [Sporosarcina sp. ANT_H38]|uniref:glutamate racemase n=1 Tax=Sporosarcina sp. ANT_H38 TaxID=2597358 RepID=UPI0011F3B26B|nr:glutamate racemase [Sporosarcina sp. ANT_H38]KAA0965260.1 glutamate racemase [Sporosarcina sp. ANT_H38]
MEAPIGVIDSGVGGLTVVKEMLNRLPHEPIVYIGDDARCPYGPRPIDEVREFTMEMASALSKMGIKMLVIACNTATAVALDDIRAQFSFPVIGVIVPGARAAVNASEAGKIAVLGTAGTIKSGAYDDAIHVLSPDAMVYSLACPEFVPIVESGQYKSENARVIVDRTLRELADKDFDAAILGCTHYPLLEHYITTSLPDSVKIISSAVETVCDVERILLSNGIGRAADNEVAPVFYTTGESESFQAIIEDWLAIEKPNVSNIEL